MELQFSEGEHNIRFIKLIGKFDMIGAGEIETQFAGYGSGENVRVIVDFSEVSFLASSGVRLLLLTAKSISKRGGKMVILNPIPDVQNVLEASGVPGIIPIYSSLESAEVVLTLS
jgi:anti-sigma B factor antagonist